MHLTAWGHLYIRHNREFRPKMVAELEAAGRLEEAAFEAQENAKDMVVSLTSRGVPAAEAQSEALKEHILLPDEREVPDLAQNPYRSL